MVTNKEEALKKIESGEISLAEIEIGLRSDEDIALAAIRRDGESAIVFLEATNSLPHTPEFFNKLMLEFQLEHDNIKMELFSKTGDSCYLPNVIFDSFDGEEIDDLYEDDESQSEIEFVDDELEIVYKKYEQNLKILSIIDNLLLKIKGVQEKTIEKEGGKSH